MYHSQHDPHTPPPGASSQPAPVEPVAEDLEEIHEQGKKLARLVEDKLERWLGSRHEAAQAWAGKLERMRDKLEQALEEVDQKVDRIAGRGPRP